ncbi:MAG: EAL domain-containing protein [Cellulosilyticaceae bacterium]
MIRWTADLEIGVTEIDEQHKMLMQILQDLYDACSRGEGLSYIKQVTYFLEWYVIKHFNDEERLQKKYKYPKIEGHVKLHKVYRDEIRVLAKEVREKEATIQHIAKVVDYLNRMITEHMKGADQALAYYIKHHEIYQEESYETFKRDSLTGLMARCDFQKLLEGKVAKDRVGEAFCILQVDGYDMVKGIYGYDLGDEVLIYVSGVLREFESTDCYIAHMYKDEFIIYVEMQEPELRMHILEKMKKSIYDGFKRKGSIIPLSATVGIGEIREGDTLKVALQKANVALEAGKESGGNQIVVYEEKIHQQMMQRVDIIKMLQPHSLRQHLRVVYQPIYNLTTQKIQGCEALMRMVDHEGNMLSPMVFIPIAEENHLITAMGYYCMARVCKDFAEIKAKLPDLDYISVNLSMHQFKDKQLVEKFANIAKAQNVSLANIYFELTESIVADETGKMKEMIKALRSQGSKILIDDFGSGYSALSYLAELEVDIIKIDKHFLKGIGENSRVECVLKHMIDLIHNLNFKTVIEGVEEKEELEKLQKLGAHSIQGYYISKPIDKNQIDKILKK